MRVMRKIILDGMLKVCLAACGGGGDGVAKKQLVAACLDGGLKATRSYLQESDPG